MNQFNGAYYLISINFKNSMVGWQQASNFLRIEPETRWMCLQPELWDLCDMSLVEAEMKTEDGTEYKYKDRLGEIYFDNNFV